MQISTQTLLASQQAAHFQAKISSGPAPGFVPMLQNGEGFVPLPLKQAAPAQDGPAAHPPVPKGAMRPGAVIDLKV
jgi:hypothetical protein